MGEGDGASPDRTPDTEIQPTDRGVWGGEMERTNTTTSDSAERTVGHFSPPLVEPPYNCLLHSVSANVLVSALYSRAIYRVSSNSTLQDIMSHLTFEFRVKFSSIEASKPKGCHSLPTIDGRNYKSWLQICEKMKSGGDEQLVSTSGDWVSRAVEVKDQELFAIKDAFVDQLRKCTALNAASKNWNVKGNGKQHIGDIRVSQHDDAELENRARPFNADHLSTFEFLQVFSSLLSLESSVDPVGTFSTS